jgi:hypothetical protein
MTDFKNATVLDLDIFNEMPQDELAEKLDGPTRSVVFTAPLSSIGRTQDPGDIAIDYLQASLMGETLARHCSHSAVEQDTRGHETFLRFSMTILAPVAFSVDYCRLRSLFLDDSDLDLTDELDEYHGTFFERDHKMPFLADKYVVNFIHGTDYLDNKIEWSDRFPEWELGFWRSFASPGLGVELFTSASDDGAWIVLGNRQQAEHALNKYGGFSASGSRLLEATSLRLDRNPHVLINSQMTVRVPTRSLEKAMHCWQRCLTPPNWQSDSTPDFFAEMPPHSSKDRWRAMQQAISQAHIHAQSNWEHRLFFTWAMTEDGEAIACNNESATLIAFADSSSRQRPSASSDLLASLETGAELLRSQLGLGAVRNYKLSSLTPEKFEDMCFDVILRSGRFDSDTTRRHGKTKSRDGGRDIEIWSRPRLGQPAMKWIFQCKHISNGKALAASRISISDVVDQYAASGFGVMTNEVIDSTLHDKLDAISQNRCILVDRWDGNRLQRFLDPRPDMILRHFPNL